MEVSIEQLLKAYQKHDYVFHQDVKINLFGIRNNDYSVGTFNDTLGIHYWKDGKDTILLHSGTVDPGSYYMNNPMNPNGTAVIRFQQVIDGWASGYHKGYKALVQIKPAWFFRITADQFHEDGNVIKLSGKTPTLELIGCNMHRGSEWNVSTKNTNWSAACQVRNNPEQYQEFLDLCWRNDPALKYNYAIFPEKDFL